MRNAAAPDPSVTTTPDLDVTALTTAWIAEVSEVLAGGVPWLMLNAWCDREGAICCVELSHFATGNRRVVSVSRRAYPSPEMRKEELLRLLH